MANYAKTNIGNEGRVELHEVLGLTGAEVSVNKLPAGAGVPFVHAHKNNEEIYGVLEGAGTAAIDGEDVKLAAGDCSASMATTYDIELWIPSMNEYKECSSVSNARDYQARRGNIRFRRADTKKIEYLHTLNGSGLATSRVIPAIVEQFQQDDGSVVVPEVLRPFLGVDVLRRP